MNKFYYRVNVTTEGVDGLNKTVDVLAKNDVHAEILAKAHVLLDTETDHVYLNALAVKFPNLVQLTVKSIDGVKLEVVKIVEACSACNGIVGQFYVAERDGKFTAYVNPKDLKLV